MKRAALILGIIAVAACDSDGINTPPPQPALTLDAQVRQSIGRWGAIPIGQMPQQNPAMVALGRALFFDKVLSGNRDISCASCHHPSKALGDGQALAVGTGASISGATRSPGAGRKFVARHSPTLLNSGLGLFYMFWDGRLTRFGQDTLPGEPRMLPPAGPPSNPNALISQAKLTVLNRREMRGDAGDRDVLGNVNELAAIGDDQPFAVWQGVMKRLTAIPEYVDLFRAAFPNKAASALTFDDAALAMAIFQMQEFTRTNSPFDRFLHRDNNALSTEAKRGALLFFGRAQCASCHNGPFLGGQSFNNAGVPQIGPGAARQMPLDLGRGELHPNNDFYRFAFRAAPLRNVELTAPYMHNGAYATLDAVIEHYNNVPQALRTYDASQLSPEVRVLHHGDDATVSAVLRNLDPRLQTPLNLTEAEKQQLITFLTALTDPAARDLSSVKPARVPSGLLVD